jgi:RNA polymerase sigma-70 factor (ECF subfamily)
MSPLPSSSSGGAHASSLDPTSWRLLSRVRLGDSSALAQLIDRYLPRLRRWAHGKLPRWARSFADTPDIVQDVLVRSIGRLDVLDPRGAHALKAYFRKAVANRIRDEYRRTARRGVAQPLAESLLDPRPSPLDDAIAKDRRERYRRALARLTPQDRWLIVGHVELHYTHEQLACMTGRSPNAARMALQRAVGRLAAHMRDD